MRRALLVFGIGVALVSGAAAQTAADPVSWALAVQPAGATSTPGGTISLALTATIDDGWHLYSLKLDPGGPIPTAISVPADQPFTQAGDIVEPLPKSAFEPNFNQVLDYHVDKVTFTIPVKSAANTPAGKQTVRVKANYQTCNDRLCLPARETIVTVDIQLVK